jgi:hypothetical protein
MPNLNTEGMAIAPASTCADGVQEVVWADDGDTDGHSLRVGTLPCPEVGPVPATVVVADTAVRFSKGGTLAVTITADGVVPSGEVTVTVGGRSLEPVTLGADGTAEVVVPRHLLKASGTPYPVVVEYSGDTAVEAATGEGLLTVTNGSGKPASPKG